MTYHFVNELGFITITQKIISLLVIGVHLGSSILLYVESFGDRLLLMRTHEDLSSDMELLVYSRVDKQRNEPGRWKSRIVTIFLLFLTLLHVLT